MVFFSQYVCLKLILWFYDSPLLVLLLLEIGIKLYNLYQWLWVPIILITERTLNWLKGHTFRREDLFLKLDRKWSVWITWISNSLVLKSIKAAFHPCVNVYIYKPINRSEWRSYVPWVIKSKAKLINNKKKVRADSFNDFKKTWTKCFAIIVLNL